MASILEEFAYGTLSMDAPYFAKDTEYVRTLELASRNEQKLRQRLGPDDQKLLESYTCMQEEALRLTATKHMIYGFRLGLMMTAETFIGMDDLYLNGNNM